MPRLKYPPPLTRVEVEWEDIYEDVVGDPSTARTAHRITTGYFLKKTRSKQSQRTIVVTCTTLEIDDEGKRKAGDQSGWCSYPIGAIIAIHWDETAKTCTPQPDAVPSNHG
jgi:hypothetical protein